MSFTRAQLESFRDATVPDLLGRATRLLFVGINPGLWTAGAQAHFARRGNRFYPALFRAGLMDRLIDASAGYSQADRQLLVDRGIGITDLVARATARADELVPVELAAGAAQPWVVPNPSGLNAHSQLPDIAAALREAGQAAGLLASPDE